MKKELDWPAIATFCAFGFFLDDDTYYKDEKFRFDTSTPDGRWLDAFARFNWHHRPGNSSLDAAVSEFARLFEEIIDEQTGGKRVILPLSGGLDSRTQAAALKRLDKKVHAFSYRFAGGIDETAYARRIASVCGFPLETWTVPGGYLWERIRELAELNGCYTDFTHPRQMAFAGSYGKLGDVFSLGHWGDVLFDGSGVDERLPVDGQVDAILKKFIKKGGQMLAEDLWKSFGLPGDWTGYIRDRVRQLLIRIPVENHAGARIRAFKSRYWATRWTAANFAVFSHERPVAAPYFDTRMCAFICTVPEELLSGRKIQIGYLRKYAPALAGIPWQAHRPFNLFNYHLDRAPLNLPYRAVNKILRGVRKLSGTKHVMRNWELQFLGEKNDGLLAKHLFVPESIVPAEVVKKYYDAFTGGAHVPYAHPLSMLLTLSVFSAQKNQ